MKKTICTPCGPICGTSFAKNTDAYLGIKYATSGRWEYPVVVTHWDGTYDATHYGAVAMQQNALVSELENGRPPFYYYEFRDGIDYSYDEACQYLNVFAPSQAKKSPVIVYIHGGAFMGGSSYEKTFDYPVWPEYNVVAVTINYRLGLFGFADLDELEQEAGHSGNYAIYDQLAALQWVKQNIAAFGGDPDNITLMGQSAGARSVQMLVGSPLSKELVHRAVMSSGGGAPSSLFADKPLRHDVREFWRKWKEACGASSVDELRALPAATLLQAFGQMFSYGFSAVINAISPYEDDYYFPTMGSAKALPKHYLDIPYLCGGNSDDITPVLHLDAVYWAEKQSCPSYAYYFSRQLPGDKSGAFHSADLWYWFGTLHNCWRPFEPRDFEISQQMTNYLANFAHTGNPNGKDLPQWDSVSSKQELMYFGDALTYMQNVPNLSTTKQTME